MNRHSYLVALLSVQLILVFHGLDHAAAQNCTLPGVVSYSGPGTNPVSLAPVGNSLPVAGASFLVRTDPGFLSGIGETGVLVLSCASTTPTSYGAQFLGTGLIDPNCLLGVLFELAHANGNVDFTVLLPPNPALTGFTFYAQSLHFDISAGLWGFSNGLSCTIGNSPADLAVTSIVVPPNLVGDVDSNNSFFPLTVTNLGNSMSTATSVVATLGLSSASVAIPPLAPGGSITVLAALQAPHVPNTSGCGTTQNFAVNATVNSMDCNMSNNSLSVVATVSAAYWDLRLSLSNVPSGPLPVLVNTSWNVHVTNMGTVASPNGSCVVTCITLFPGSTNFDNSLGFTIINTGSLFPGQTQIFPITYYVPILFPFGLHWCKAIVSPLCPEVCTLGDFVQQAVQVGL